MTTGNTGFQRDDPGHFRKTSVNTTDQNAADVIWDTCETSLEDRAMASGKYTTEDMLEIGMMIFGRELNCFTAAAKYEMSIDTARSCLNLYMTGRVRSGDGVDVCRSCMASVYDSMPGSVTSRKQEKRFENMIYT